MSNEIEDIADLIRRGVAARSGGAFDGARNALAVAGNFGKAAHEQFKSANEALGLDDGDDRALRAELRGALVFGLGVSKSIFGQADEAVPAFEQALRLAIAAGECLQQINVTPRDDYGRMPRAAAVAEQD